VELFQTVILRHWPIALAMVAAATLLIVIAMVVRRRRARSRQPVEIA
jgi:hypothetical protein